MAREQRIDTLGRAEGRMIMVGAQPDPSRPGLGSTKCAPGQAMQAAQACSRLMTPSTSDGGFPLACVS